VSRRQALTLGEQNVKQVFENIAGTTVVGVGKRALCNTLKPYMIPFAPLAPQTDLYVAETLEPPGLRKQQYIELLPAVHTFRVPVAIVPVDTLGKIIPINQLHYLSKYRMFNHRANSLFVSQNF